MWRWDGIDCLSCVCGVRKAELISRSNHSSQVQCNVHCSGNVALRRVRRRFDDAPLRSSVAIVPLAVLAKKHDA